MSARASCWTIRCPDNNELVRFAPMLDATGRASGTRKRTFIQKVTERRLSDQKLSFRPVIDVTTKTLVFRARSSSLCVLYATCLIAS